MFRSRIPRSQVSCSNASELAGPLVSRGLQQLSCLIAQESSWLTASSLWWYYFLKGKKWHLLSFSFLCSPWIRKLVFCLSVFVSFSFFFWSVCSRSLPICILSLAFFLPVSWDLIYENYWYFSYCKHFLFTGIFILSFFFLDSSFFGFCETDLQGASKSSGMPFFILFEFILYIYAFFIPKDWRNNWRGANFIMNT